MDTTKYVGYLVLEIADATWSSGLCRVASP
jgi:hypothetical protein